MTPPIDNGIRRPDELVDDVFDAIDSDVLASRGDVVVRAAAMLETVNRELTRLQVLEDCAATLKSANDSAIALLQDAAARAALAVAEEPRGERRWP